MQFLRRSLLFVLVTLGISLVNDALSPEYSVLTEWIHGEGAPEMDSCSPPMLDEEERNSYLFYAVVIDAGSTGTRLHLFEFAHHNIESVPFRVEKETFKEVKPGLSGFANRPEGAADSVDELLLAAKETIPEALWAHTPITLKATAGLRLLPAEQADAILAVVEERVAQSGFLVNDGAVGVLSGTDEGVFSWFTLNLLTDRLAHLARPNAQRKERAETKVEEEKEVSENEKGEELVRMTAAALDLGGGSTQVTFAPTRLESAFAHIDRTLFSHELDLFGNPISLYTHSYLGNGLVAARVGMAERLSSSENASAFVNHCFPPGFSVLDIDYTRTQWNVSGSPLSSFSECLRSAREYVRKSDVREIPELGDYDIYAFAYFFDRGVQADLIEKSLDKRGGLCTVADFRRAALTACSREAHEIGPEHWRPWQCLDLVYIYALLHHGYGLREDKQIYLASRLRDMEVSWALGASYELLRSCDRRRRRSVHRSPSPTPPRNFSVLLPNTHQNCVVHWIAEQTSSVLSYLRIIS